MTYTMTTWIEGRPNETTIDEVIGYERTMIVGTTDQTTTITTSDSTIMATRWLLQWLLWCLLLLV